MPFVSWYSLLLTSCPSLSHRHMLSALFCERKWLLTGDEEHVKSKIRVLELGSAIASLVAPSPTSRHQKEAVADSLRAAKKLKSIL